MTLLGYLLGNTLSFEELVGRLPKGLHFTNHSDYLQMSKEWQDLVPADEKIAVAGQLATLEAQALLAVTSPNAFQVLETKDLRKRLEKEATPDLRIFVDDDRISFVLYDARFLTTLDEKYIHGYGFLRDASVGQYFFRIEHDKQYAQLTSTIGLQLVRDSGSPVYAAESPGDQIEWQLVPHAKYKDGYVTLTKDVLPLAKLAAQERKLRRKVDPYQEIQQSLIELAEYKNWNA